MAHNKGVWVRDKHPFFLLMRAFLQTYATQHLCIPSHQSCFMSWLADHHPHSSNNPLFYYSFHNQGQTPCSSCIQYIITCIFGFGIPTPKRKTPTINRIGSPTSHATSSADTKFFFSTSVIIHFYPNPIAPNLQVSLLSPLTINYFIAKPSRSSNLAGGKSVFVLLYNKCVQCIQALYLYCMPSFLSSCYLSWPSPKLLWQPLSPKPHL